MTQQAQKASMPMIKSPTRSPPKKQILPQMTMDLIHFKVLEDHKNNAKKVQGKSIDGFSKGQNSLNEET